MIKYLWKANPIVPLNGDNPYLAFKHDSDAWSIRNPETDKDWCYAMTESDYKETIAHFGIKDVFEKEEIE